MNLTSFFKNLIPFHFNILCRSPVSFSSLAFGMEGKGLVPHGLLYRQHYVVQSLPRDIFFPLTEIQLVLVHSLAE